MRLGLVLGLGFRVRVNVRNEVRAGVTIIDRGYVKVWNEVRVNVRLVFCVCQTS